MSLPAFEESRQYHPASHDALLPTSPGHSLASYRNILLVVAIYALGAGIMFPGAFFHLLPIKARLFFVVLSWAAIAAALIAMLRTPRTPWTSLRRTVVERGPVALGSMAAFAIGLTAFSTIKVNIPEIVPFYADPYVADLERTLLGEDAWRLAHSILSPSLASLVDFIYSRVWFVALLMCFAAAAVTAKGSYFKRFMWTAAVVYIGLGSILATLLSSVGPIFYDKFYALPRFPVLTERLTERNGFANVPDIAEYLLWSYKNDVAMFGTGISALPSIHVAIAVLTAWYLTSVGRWAAIAGWFYAVVIGFGSVYTGWHYALDGMISLVVVSSAWIGLSRRYKLSLMPVSEQALIGSR